MALILMFSGRDMMSQVDNTGKLESWLKELKLDYIDAGDGWFKIPFDVKGEISMIYAWESFIIENDPATRYISLSTLIIDVPDNFVHSPAMLKAMLIFNGNLTFGNLNLVENTGDIIYNSTIWLNPSSPDLLLGSLYLSHYARVNARKALLPFMDE